MGMAVKLAIGFAVVFINGTWIAFYCDSLVRNEHDVTKWRLALYFCMGVMGGLGYCTVAWITSLPNPYLKD